MLAREGEEAAQAATDRANERGIAAEGEVLQGDPYRTILDYAEVRVWT